jgi:glycosyltransferase involved in cell wall biosynthesis
MICIDVTKTGRAGHRSGLTRVTTRLREELGGKAIPVEWTGAGFDPVPGRGDWLVTAELFSEPERPGMRDFLGERACMAASIFHDAIPLRHPHITWPQSVARHPDYLGLLARFDRILAVSEASRRDLLGFWRFQDIAPVPPVSVLPLGADFNRQARRSVTPGEGVPLVLCVGILEPRKNQGFLVEVCESLWAAGFRFELHLVGRINPHFGRPIADRIRSLRAAGRPIHHHVAPGDAALEKLYAQATCTVFPTIAEGCGLPLLESLWMGVPCLCSDLPVLREQADGGGCTPIPVGDAPAWAEALRNVLSRNSVESTRLREAIASRPLPSWADSAAALARELEMAVAGTGP